MEFKKGDKVLHKTDSKLMVIIGFSDSLIAHSTLANIRFRINGYLDDSSLPFVVCSYIEDCNKKILKFEKAELEHYN